MPLINIEPVAGALSEKYDIAVSITAVIVAFAGSGCAFA
jgi:phenylpyruvate tautomerase PptA (4-oxalocrotonate tautomerase family)